MSYTIFKQEETRLTVIPEGRLDTATSPEFQAELQPYLEKAGEVIIDLERVEYISSGGIRVLLATDQQMEDKGGTMKIIHANKYILEVFELMGFMDLVSVEKDQ